MRDDYVKKKATLLADGARTLPLNPPEWWARFENEYWAQTLSDGNERPDNGPSTFFRLFLTQ